MKTVYALGSAGVVWGWIWGLLALAVGITAVRELIRILRQPPPPDINQGLGNIGGVLFALVLCMIFSMLARQQYDRRSALAEAAERAPVQIAEGCVQVLHEQPGGGHSSGDLIVVGGAQFEIDYYDSGPGYGKTISHGGVLRAGTAVRIHHYGNIIVRIDTLPQACP